MNEQLVHVRLFAAAAEAAGYDEVDVPAGSLSSILAEVGKAAPDASRWQSVLQRCSVLVDGLVADPARAESVGPGVRVDVLPPFAGG